MTAARYERHGLSRDEYGNRTPLHNAWRTMRKRCNNPRTADYPYYGGRGIKVCERWDRFVNFAADMGPHPGAGWTLDRINPNGNYEPDNCRWATRLTQGRNNRKAQINETIADNIRQLNAAGYKRIDIARIQACSINIVNQVIRGNTWL